MSAVPVVLTGADQALYTPAAGSTGVGTLLGWSLRAAAACSVNVRSGIDATGPIVAVIELGAAGESTRWFGPQGIQCRGGIFFDVLAGTPVGAAYIS